MKLGAFLKTRGVKVVATHLFPGIPVLDHFFCLLECWVMMFYDDEDDDDGDDGVLRVLRMIGVIGVIGMVGMI